MSLSGSHDLGHDRGHDHGEHADHGIPHASLRDYATGFALAVLLTAIPFGLVMGGAVASPAMIAGVILVCAGLQVVVHMVYFLHMSPRSEGGWNLLALVFTGVLVVIVMAGSLWVMHHMNANMMPGGHDAHTDQAGHAASQPVL